MRDNSPEPAYSEFGGFSNRSHTLGLDHVDDVLSVVRRYTEARPPKCISLCTHTLAGDSQMATFVLVHGGWHGGWCWKRVTPHLHAAGHVEPIHFTNGGAPTIPRTYIYLRPPGEQPRDTDSDLPLAGRAACPQQPTQRTAYRPNKGA